MSDQAMLDQFMINWQTHPSADFSRLYTPAEPSCYEVIRLMGGRPLFLNEHYDRLTATARSIGQALPFSLSELEGHITDLARANGAADYNVKLIYNDFAHGGTVYLFFTPTSYPTAEMYEKGVATDFLNAIRANPHAKIINQSLRDDADALMAEKGLFEAVLVNEKGEVTEGSKSNLFFIRGDALVTSPAEAVLLGVTRQRILRLAAEHGIPVSQEPIPADSLGRFSAGFISGTSPKVLPIKNVGDKVRYDVNDPLLRKIMALYDGEIDRYLNR